MPFIAITERAFSRLVNEQYDVLQRGIAVHERLERLVIEERGLDEIVARDRRRGRRHGVVHDARGEPLAAQRRPARARPSARPTEVAAPRPRRAARRGPFEPAHPALAGRALALPVAAGGAAAPLALARGRRRRRRARRVRAPPAAGGDGRRPRADARARRARDRAAPGRRRARRGARRPARRGRAAAPPASRSAIGDRRRCSSSSSTTPRPRGGRSSRRSRQPASRGAGRRTSAGPGLLCAVIDGADVDPVELAGGAPRGARRGARRRPRRRQPAAPASARCGAASTRRAARSRRRPLANGDGRPRSRPTRPRRVHAAALAAGRRRAAALLRRRARPDRATEGDYGDELLRSLEAFIEHNGHWERAARELYCHRHTLRYRIRKVEELTGRDLSPAHATGSSSGSRCARGSWCVRVAVLGAGGTIAPAIVRDLAESDEVDGLLAARLGRRARRRGRRRARRR